MASFAAAGGRGVPARLLSKGPIPPVELSYLVEAADGYTAAQLEQAANTLFILAVDRENTIDDGNTISAQPQYDDSGYIPFNRGLIEAALQEMQIERRVRMGFHVA